MYAHLDVIFKRQGQRSRLSKNQACKKNLERKKKGVEDDAQSRPDIRGWILFELSL